MRLNKRTNLYKQHLAYIIWRKALRIDRFNNSHDGNIDALRLGVSLVIDGHVFEPFLNDTFEVFRVNKEREEIKGTFYYD